MTSIRSRMPGIHIKSSYSQARFGCSGLQVLRLAIVLSTATLYGCAPNGATPIQPQTYQSPPEVTPLDAEGDPDKRYFLMRRPQRDDNSGPQGLVLIIPGGPGDDSMRGFVENLYRYGVPRGYLAARLLAKKWTDDQRIVWPTDKVSVPAMRFSTREFVEAVITDVGLQHPLDANRIFLLAWSSGGPAAYESALTSEKVRGAYIAASIFNPDLFPPLAGGAGRSFFIAHSPDDALIPYEMAESARDRLGGVGARVKLTPYSGGHGRWMGPAFAPVFQGLLWLESAQ